MRTKKLLTIIALLAIVVFVFYAVNATPIVSDNEWTYIGGMNWYQTYDEGSAVAKETGKPMLVYFWTIWCTYCEKMQVEVFPYPPVKEILQEDFVRIAIDMDINKEDTNRFNVQAPPHELFLDEKGAIITRVPGYVAEDTFLDLVIQVRDFHHSQMKPVLPAEIEAKNAITDTNESEHTKPIEPGPQN
jgi:thioredoxin-related protein